MKTTKDPLPNIVKLWIFRVLVKLHCNYKLLNHRGFSNTDLPYRIGLGGFADTSPLDIAGARAEIFRIYEKFEAGAPFELPEQLARNIATLGEMVGLNDVESAILGFSIMVATTSELDDCCDLLGQINVNALQNHLSAILDIPFAQVREHLSFDSRLLQSGLIKFNGDGTRTLFHMLLPLSATFASTMINEDIDGMHFLRDLITVSPEATLSKSDYTHLKDQYELLSAHIETALDSGTGVNILLHGIPGTGKSMLARSLAKDLNTKLMEIASEELDGEVLLPDERLQAFKAANFFFKNQRVILLFDECSDIFDRPNMFTIGRSNNKKKAWINKSLENTSVPAIWITNAIDDIDPAYLRRFTMVVEVPIPDVNQRSAIVGKLTAGLDIDASCLSKIVANKHLSPALIAQSAHVVDGLRDKVSISTSKSMEIILNNSLSAQGYSLLSSESAKVNHKIYDPSFINADIDVEKIVNGLSKSKSGRICLFGPAGTGKTNFCHYLGNKIGMDVIVKRASDLMSKYVGGTEKNYAAAFREATDANAILVIDEVDSFLQDRSTVSHSWESSMINEFLTQLESFQGIFFASTNLVKNLDQAALRRFDLKVKFDYLKPHQSVTLLKKYSDHLELNVPSDLDIHRVNSMYNATVGDYAACARQSKFNPFVTTTQFVDALVTTCSLKKDGVKHSLGFVTESVYAH